MFHVSSNSVPLQMSGAMGPNQRDYGAISDQRGLWAVVDGSWDYWLAASIEFLRRSPLFLGLLFCCGLRHNKNAPSCGLPQGRGRSTKIESIRSKSRSVSEAARLLLLAISYDPYISDFSFFGSVLTRLFGSAGSFFR